MLEEWALATRKHEGFYPGSRSYRNNNPGNLRYTAYSASLGANKGKDNKNFIIYDTYDIGFNALKQLLVDASSNVLARYRGDMSLLEFYKVFAPSSDGNSPMNYATFIAKEIGVTIDTEIREIVAAPIILPTPEKIPLEYYWQRHPRYKGLKIGHSNTSFQDSGCFTHCLAWMARIDPKEALQRLTDGGAYGGSNGDLIISPKAAEILGLELLQGNDKILPGKMTNVDYMPMWSPCIKEVRLGKSQHFVIRLIGEHEMASSNYRTYIFDPWTGAYWPINYYKFRSYRLFRQM